MDPFDRGLPVIGARCWFHPQGTAMHCPCAHGSDRIQGDVPTPPHMLRVWVPRDPSTF